MPRTASTARTAAPIRIAPTVQCFRAGRHTAMSGATLAFAQSDLAAMAGAYDPALHEAPIVIGHPRLDAPAFGWVGGLRLAGSSLEATPRKVDPAFAQAVQSGAYGKVSAAFYAPDAANNPVPGVYYLRHIGFLGATAPAVKGLRDPAAAITDPAAAYADADADADADAGAYAEPEPGVVVFSEWDDVDNASLWRSLRDWVLSKFGQVDADTAVPGYLVQSLDRAAQAELARAADAPTDAAAGLAPAPAFAQIDHPTETHVTETEKLALEAENTRLRNLVAANDAAALAARLAAAHGDAVAFADGLKEKTQVTEAEHEAVVKLQDLVAEHAETAGAAVEFGEGEARAPLLPALRLLLASLPPRAALGRLATSARAAGGATDAGLAFAAPDGTVADPTSLVLHAKVKAFQFAHPGTAYEPALKSVLAAA